MRGTGGVAKRAGSIGGLPLVWRVLTYQRTYGDNPHPDDVPAAQ